MLLGYSYSKPTICLHIQLHIPSYVIYVRKYTPCTYKCLISIRCLQFILFKSLHTIETESFIICLTDDQSTNFSTQVPTQKQGYPRLSDASLVNPLYPLCQHSLHIAHHLTEMLMLDNSAPRTQACNHWNKYWRYLPWVYKLPLPQLPQFAKNSWLEIFMRKMFLVKCAHIHTHMQLHTHTCMHIHAGVKEVKSSGQSMYRVR